MAYLWSLLTDYLETELAAEMGAGGLYTTLVLKEVVNNSDWRIEDAIRNNNLPIGIVRPLDIKESGREHGSFGDTGKTRLTCLYGYLLITMTVAEDRATCQTNIATMRARVLQFVKARPTPPLIDETGERVRRIITNQTVPRTHNSGSVSAFYGITETYIEVETYG